MVQKAKDENRRLGTSHAALVLQPASQPRLHVSPRGVVHVGMRVYVRVRACECVCVRARVRVSAGGRAGRGGRLCACGCVHCVMRACERWLAGEASVCVRACSCMRNASVRESKPSPSAFVMRV